MSNLEKFYWSDNRFLKLSFREVRIAKHQAQVWIWPLARWLMMTFKCKLLTYTGFFFCHSPPFDVSVGTFLFLMEVALVVTKDELVCEVNSKCLCYQPFNNNLLQPSAGRSCVLVFQRLWSGVHSLWFTSVCRLLSEDFRTLRLTE